MAVLQRRGLGVIALNNSLENRINNKRDNYESVHPSKVVILVSLESEEKCLPRSSHRGNS